jgi:histidinol phosphatase-like PHP family hydrolase
LKLKEIAKRLRNKIKDLEVEIIAIKESEQHQTIIEIEDWDKYFDDLKIILGDELETLEKELAQDE